MKIVKKLVKQEYPVYIVKMCGDYNDGDYSYSEEEYNENEFNKIAECLLEVNKLVGRDYVNEDYGYETVSEHISELQEIYKVDFDYPSGDTASDCEIHSLESLDIQFIDTDGKVYDVTLHDGLK
jgi:hypothetical protein